MGDILPEIKEKQEYVKKVIKGEEESFNATLDRGIELFEELIEKLKKKRPGLNYSYQSRLEARKSWADAALL